MKRGFLLLLLLLCGCRKPEAPPERIASLGEVTALTVEAKGETTRLEKQNGSWRIVAPIQADADKAAVEGILSQLKTAHFKSVVAERPTDDQLKTFGLARPRFVVRAEGFALQGGAENAFDGSVYVRREGDPKVYAAPGAVRFALERSALELRDRSLFPLEVAAVKKITFPTVELERVDAKTWKITRPSAAKADAASVGALLGALKHERVLSFPLERFEGADLVVRFEPTLRLQVRGNRALVEKPGSSFVAEVSPSVAVLLQKTPKDFRDRSLLSFIPAEVAHLRFQPGNFTVDRSGDNWAVKGAKAKRFRMSSVMWLLESLKAQAVIEARPKDWKRYGLGEGARSITLLDAKGRTLATLLLGSEQDGNVYARGTRDEVVEIDAMRLADLPRKVDDVLDQAQSQND